MDTLRYNVSGASLDTMRYKRFLKSMNLALDTIRYNVSGPSLDTMDTNLTSRVMLRSRPPRCWPRRCSSPAPACCGPSSRASPPASTPQSPSRSPRAAQTADQPEMQCSQSSCSQPTAGLLGAPRAVPMSTSPPTTPRMPRCSTSGRATAAVESTTLHLTDGGVYEAGVQKVAHRRGAPLAGTANPL